MTDKIKLKADKFVNDKKLKLNYIKTKDLKILLAEFCEEQIAELKAECDLAIEGRDVKIKELETRCNELFLQTMQLTNAKEIIKEFVEWANWQGNSKCPSFKSIQDKAEQFLKDSEVENDSNDKNDNC